MIKRLLSLNTYYEMFVVLRSLRNDSVLKHLTESLQAKKYL